MDSPKLLYAINEERKATKALVKKHNINGIISDNRLGVRSKKVPNIFITHQLNVLSGSTTWLSTKIHQNIIKKFDECWVPDNEFTPNLSGKLGHTNNTSFPVKYLGPLSRLKKTDTTRIYDLMVLLSGPEPQRSLLENKLLKELNMFKGKVLFVRGVIEAEENITIKENITIYNFMQSNALEQGINSSNIILSRSGYTTVMDLAKIGKKAFFIPTPGQFEQEYLAKTLDEMGLVPACSQDNFKIELLCKVSNYKGLDIEHSQPNYKLLFGLFESK